jgi:hypothetical protein
MLSRKIMTALLGVMLVCAGVHAEEKGKKTLTTQDYVEIQQLYAHYAIAIDTRAEDGMLWARMFTPDGEFQTGEIKAVGHKALADMNRRDGKPSPIPTHFTVNIAIDPSPEGARGMAYLMTTGGEGGKMSGSVYQDVLVKTADGWRFKKRTLFQGAMPK